MEEFSKVEREVLVLCRRISRWQQSPVAREVLTRRAALRLGIEPEKVEQVCDALEAGGWLIRVGDEPCMALGEDSQALARLWDREMSRADFDESLVASDRSPTYALFCRRVYGMHFTQFNLVDHQQWVELLKRLNLKPKERVLDLGCGVGAQAEYLSDHTGAHVVGVDFSKAAVDRASHRTVGKRDRVQFQVADFNELALPAGSFECAVCFDSLYFAEDLNATLSGVMASLTPAGRLAAFYSQMLRPNDAPEILEPQSTQLAQALTQQGCSFEWVEFTAEERAFWMRYLEVTLSLKPAFAAEGHAKMAQDMEDEARGVLELHDARMTRRYLYLGQR